MRFIILFSVFITSFPLFAAPHFLASKPALNSKYIINAKALCATATETLAYLNKGEQYDPQVIHEGRVFKLPLNRIKATLVFICQHQNQINDPAFIHSHFDFFKWYPDKDGANALKQKSILLTNLPKDRILMTKYYVHQAKMTAQPSGDQHFALYGLPRDEAHLTLEQADANPRLIRFQYGKQAILRGALTKYSVPVLGYLSRDDLEAALLQGTLVAEFNKAQPKVFNVHRTNNIPYDKTKPPYLQERYWFFKQVKGIKGYGKDADHKITVNPEVTFAADLMQFGLGKLLLVQYPYKGELITKAGVFADTGGAFQNNLYQMDYLAGSYRGSKAFYQANHYLPDYVTAYFMVLKE